MLAIAVSGHEIRYFIWDRSGEDIILKSCQVIPWEEDVNGFHNVASIREMIQRLTSEVDEADREATYLTLDAGFCQYSILQVDPDWPVQEQLDYLQLSRVGSAPLYDSYQYPLASGAGQYLNIDCPLVLRRAVTSALPAGREANTFLTLGLFSAYSYVTRVVPALNRGRHLFWRASGSGEDQLLEVEDGEFRALHLLDRTGESVRVQSIGDQELQKPIISLVEQLLAGEDSPFPEVENIFVYQGSGNSDFLESVFQREQSSLSLMNPFWRWNWPNVPDADNRFSQSAFAELADAIWAVQSV